MNLNFDGTNEQLLTIKSLDGVDPTHQAYSFTYKYSFISIAHTFSILKYLGLPLYLNLSKPTIR